MNRGKEKGRTLLLRSITVVAWHSHPVQAIVYVVVRRVVLGVLDALNEVVSQSLGQRLRFGSCHVLLLDVEPLALALRAEALAWALAAPDAKR